MPTVIQSDVPVRGLRVGTRAVRRGALASVGLAVFYVVVVALASGSGGHLVDQMRQDWLYLVVILTGFGVQVALLSELRHRRALQPELAAVGGAGATAAGVGMVACCAHHLAELVPLVGMSGAAVFLTDYRAPIMLVGVAVNLTGVFFAARALAKVPLGSVLDDARGGLGGAS